MSEGWQHFQPKEVFLTKGVGTHKDRLTSFELALRKARIAWMNLVHVSSIFPPHCKIVPIEKGLTHCKPGQIAYCVMSRNETNENRRLISAAVGIAIPKDPSMYGYLSEHHDYGADDEATGDHAEDQAANMLCTILGVDYDMEATYDKKREIWKISDQIYKTMSISQSAHGQKGGLWTTVLSACVFVR